MSMSPLLSQQLTQLSPSALPQEVAMERARLLRRSKGAAELGPLLGKWSTQIQSERQRVAEGKPPCPQDSTESQGREVLARKVASALASLARRVAVERPSLKSYNQILANVREPSAYVPEPCPYEPFETQSEDSSGEYAELLKKADKRAMIKAERTFSYSDSTLLRSAALLICVLGAAIGFGGQVHTWEEASTADALLLLGINMLLTGGVVQLHAYRKKKAAFDEHYKRAWLAEEAAARRDIERRERARLNMFLENSRRRRESHDANDAQRREAFERQEASRIELVRRIATGKDVDKVLESLLPLPLPIRFTVAHKATVEGRLELHLRMPSHDLLPTSADLSNTLGQIPASPMDKEVMAQIIPLAAGVAIRHLSELFFHLPTLRAARVLVSRPVDGPDPRVGRLVHVEGNRRSMKNLANNGDPMVLLRSLRCRIYYENISRQDGARAAS